MGASRYREVAGELHRQIIDGVYAANALLPSESAIAERFAVSRGTIRNALASLERRGLIGARRNVGWFVRASNQVQGFDRMRSFAQWAEMRGMTPGARIVARECGTVTPREAPLLRVPAGREVLRFTRIRTLDGRVVMVERSTWAPWVAPVIEAMPDDAPSTTRVLAAAGVAVVFGNHRIEAVAASSDDARLLGVRRSSPLLQVRRETFGRDGQVIEVAADRYVPHTIAFEAHAAGAAEGLLAPPEGAA